MSNPLLLSNNFISRALREGVSLSPMKLQKLIYFVYRDYLKATDKPLFSEGICAWRTGPVVESVDAHFGSFGPHSIDSFYKDSAGRVSMLSEALELFRAIVDGVWRQYGGHAGGELEELTRQKGTTWRKAWAKKRPYLDDKDIKRGAGVV